MSLSFLPTQIRKLWKRMVKGNPETNRICFDSEGRDGKATRLTVAKLFDGSFRWNIQSESKTPEVVMTPEKFKELTVFIAGEEIQK